MATNQPADNREPTIEGMVRLGSHVGGTLETLGITDGPIDAEAVLASVASPDAGANVLFLGTTRAVTPASGDVAQSRTLRLEYEAHVPLARAEIARLHAEAIDRFSLSGCGIVHRIGVVEVGKASIAVAVSATHRDKAFEAAQWLMEQVKRRVPIWKCEIDPDGVRTWIHPTSPSSGVRP